MSFNKKLPVFFHVPKCAGTYTFNKIFYVIRNYICGPNIRHIIVKRGEYILYRLLCSSEEELAGKYKCINDRWTYSVDYDDLDLNDLNLLFIEVCARSLNDYKDYIYKNLPDNLDPYEFIFLREPYERTLSLYNYLSSHRSDHEPTAKGFDYKSFSDYLKSDNLEESWLIREMLKLSDETIVTEEHFDEICKILDGMLVSNLSDVDSIILKVCKECFKLKDFDLTIKEKHERRNENSSKQVTPYKDLDKDAQKHFDNKTKWDKLLYHKYANNKIISPSQKRGKLINCFYDGANGGFGDFLRGSVHLFNHCMSKGRNFDVNINRHPIKKYFRPLENLHKQFKIQDLALEAIERKQYIYSLKKLTESSIILTKPQETKYIFSNYHPCLTDANDIINYLNLMPPINNRCCAFLQNRLQFSDEINHAVHNALKEEGIKPAGYNVIHFRLGDQNSFSNHGKDLEDLYKHCLSRCFIASLEDKKTIIVLSDSNGLKDFLSKNKKDLPIHTLHLESNHMQSKPSGFSGEIETTDEGLFYAVFDMKLVTLANSVESYSIYNHGSGFVYWIAKIFGVPVKLNLIK